MRYNILWIDDDYKTQLDFIGEAEQEGIDIIPFESHEEGMADLNARHEYYHGVILDAKVKKFKDDKITGLTGLSASVEMLVKINKNGYLPYFIFTGQPDYLTSDIFKQSFGDHYIKAKDNDRLFTDLKNAVEKKEEYQIQKLYQNVFDVCAEKYLGEVVRADILTAIKASQSGPAIDLNFDFTKLRKIQERLYKKLNEIAIIPDEIFKISGWFNPCGYFLAGTHKSYKIKEGVVHPTIGFLINQITQVAQDASHNIPDKLKLSVDEFIRQNQTGYLYCSTLNQLLDVLVWLKRFVDRYPDPELNKKLWFKIETDYVNDGDWEKGIVIRIADNGWGTFKPDTGTAMISMPPKMITDNNLTQNSLIAIRTEPSKDGTKIHIKEIRTI